MVSSRTTDLGRHLFGWTSEMSTGQIISLLAVETALDNLASRYSNTSPNLAVVSADRLDIGVQSGPTPRAGIGN